MVSILEMIGGEGEGEGWSREFCALKERYRAQRERFGAVGLHGLG